ncbi:hypothetical protein JAAARDRAFT_196929 [Jaapia argillacea MUCL 33604]|uniref:Uncharacterized protein n=1 Tax=Jaapia argillacea MUCL 33604 TaxID=933084 RepID=A0A067PSB4_9AGAM|nr:hypothetical protein JAAARDRAFT_196929 [Jaapia argillacea MUCL 33604]
MASGSKKTGKLKGKKQTPPKTNGVRTRSTQKNPAAPPVDNAQAPDTAAEGQTDKRGPATEAQATITSNQGRTLEDMGNQLKTLENLIAQAQEARIAAENTQKEAKAQLEAHEAAAKENTNSQRSKDNKLIPKLVLKKGEALQLQRRRGLEDNMEHYNFILREVRVVTQQSGLDWRKDWRQHPAAGLADAFAVARHRAPTLENYENDWATAEIIKQYFGNLCRQYGEKTGEKCKSGGNRPQGRSKHRKIIGQVDMEEDGGDEDSGDDGGDEEGDDGMDD